MLFRFWSSIIILSFVICHLSFAQDISDLALKRGIGVRAAGMGAAFSAVADDGSALFYNPAGLSEKGFAYTYGNLDTNQKKIEGIFDFLKLGFLGYGSWKAKNVSGDEVNTTALGFGSRSGWLSWGMSYKNLNWTLSGTKSEGWSSDLGFLLRVSPQLKVGILAQDLLTTKSFIAPASGRLGLSFSPIEKRLTLAGDIEISRSLGINGHLGIETKLIEGLSFRTGLDRGELTLGMSLDFRIFSLDYAALFSQGETIQRFEAGLKIFPERERPFSIIKPQEYALIDISGNLRGGRSEYSLLGGLKPGVDTILEQIRKASRDSLIDGIVLKIGGISGGLGGMAIVQELRSELKRARGKGKKIIAYLEGEALGDEYYLAAVADKIVAPPAAVVGGLSKSIEIYRAAELFKKFGIEWQIVTKGKYKTAFDWLTSEMSEEQKEMIEGIVSDLYRQMLTDISQDRKVPLSKIKEIGTGIVFSSKRAKELGLVDEIGYFRDAVEKEARIIEPQLVEEEVSLFAQFFEVAVIEIDGEIVSGKGGENIIFGGRYIGADTISEYIRKASDNFLVKAIILRINSPGGSAVAAGEISKAIQYAKERKKIVIASLGSIGASGGYYIAASADKIVADRSTITGSIGVMGALPVYSELMEKLGVKAEVVKEGKHADMFSGLRKLSREEWQALEKILDETYQNFIQAVVEGRKLSTAEVEELAEGKVYTALKAKELKLVDELGGFYDAVELAAKEAKVTGEPRLTFYRQASALFKIGEGVSEKLGLKDWFRLLWKEEDR